MTIAYICPDTLNTEALMQKALLNHFDWRANACFWNVHLLAWESDMLVISKSGYCTEVEIKTSWPDWKNDHLKDKWGKLNLDWYWKHIKRFSYAVPDTLYSKHGIPDTVNPDHGVMVLSPRKYGKLPKVSIVREAKINSKAKPLPQDKLDTLYRSSYFKLNTRFLAGK